MFYAAKQTAQQHPTEKSDQLTNVPTEKSEQFQGEISFVELHKAHWSCFGAG